LTAAKFKPFIFPVSGFAYSDVCPYAGPAVEQRVGRAERGAIQWEGSTSYFTPLISVFVVAAAGVLEYFDGFLVNMGAVSVDVCYGFNIRSS
jgi:hypothetical protein